MEQWAWPRLGAGPEAFHSFGRPRRHSGCGSGACPAVVVQLLQSDSPKQQALHSRALNVPQALLPAGAVQRKAMALHEPQAYLQAAAQKVAGQDILVASEDQRRSKSRPSGRNAWTMLRLDGT